MYTGQKEKYIAAVFNFSHSPNTTTAASISIAANVTRYLATIGGTAAAPATDIFKVVMSRPGVLKNLYYKALPTSTLTNATHKFTVLKNGAVPSAPEGLSAFWNPTAKSGSDLTGYINVILGDVISVQVQTFAGTGTIIRPAVSFELEVDDDYPNPWDFDPASKIISYSAGNVVVNGEIRSNTGFRFPDGSVQTTATVAGTPGPQGIPGPQGPQGIPGSSGGADDSMLVASLMNQSQHGVNTNHTTAFVMRDGNIKVGGLDLQGSLGLGVFAVDSPHPVRVIRPFSIGFSEIVTDQVNSIHMCYSSVHVLTKGGSVYGWGYNVHGEVGDGTTVMRATPQRIYMRDQNGVVLNPQPKIDKLVSTQNGSADESLSWYALSNTGKVWAWGYNEFGQLAVGDYSPRLVPTLLTNLPSNDPVRDIEAAGGAYGSVFAITSTNEAWAAGYSKYGQTGLGTSNQVYFVKVDLPGACAKIRSTGSGSYGHTLWLLSNGDVCAAGANEDGFGSTGTTPLNTSVTGDPKLITGLSGIGDIWAIGGRYGCNFASRPSDGALFVWGCNGYGQLGLGDTNHRHVPAQHPLTNIVAVVGASDRGTIHTVLLDANGFAYASGSNNYGQCGVGFASPMVVDHKLIHLPIGIQGSIVQVGFMGFREFTGTQLLDANGRVWVCGYNGGNMLCLGDTNLTYVSIPQKVDM